MLPFFDRPIQKAEANTILNAVKHNWDTTRGNGAGLLDVLSQHIHLDEQDIHIEEEELGVATVTVQQILRNTTLRPKESVLHFSLPEDAALTGVWLSDEADDPNKYPYVLSPKGAAQAVYKAEVRRGVDPALLEQTGPYQYRLRVFPVLGNSESNPDKNLMYVRFTYQVLADPSQYWPMPRVLEKRNLYWDQDTRHTLNGKPVADTINGFPTQPPLQKRGRSNTPPANLQFQYGQQQFYAVPRTATTETLPQTGNFAVLIDGSYSMRGHYTQLLKELKQLENSKATFSLYFCQLDCKAFSPGSGSSSDDTPIAPPFFGDSQTPDHLRAFSQHADAANFDAVMVLTDTGSYELSRGQSKTTAQEQLRLTMPLWLVHLGDVLPYAYDDQVLDRLYRSGGGIAGSLPEALKRYDIKDTRQQYEQVSQQNEAKLIGISEQNLWFAEALNPDDTTQPAPERKTGTSAIAAAHWIRHLGQTADTKQLETLDKIHELAKAEHIVTHYSSMLVLVNDRQRDALKKAEQQDDRFDREVETGKQTTTQPTDMLSVPAVPEPEEWALLLIILSLLTIILWRRQRAGLLA